MLLSFIISRILMLERNAVQYNFHLWAASHQLLFISLKDLLLAPLRHTDHTRIQAARSLWL
ncbi:MAG: hypothetical protein ACI8PV_001411, partial [Dinoroseobacter sp.]